MSEAPTTLKIKGLLMWPKIFQPDTKFDDKWTLDLLLDKEGLATAKEHGLRISKKRKDGTVPYADQFDGYDGSYLRIQKNCKDRNGKPMDPPKVKDVTGKVDVDPDTGIGNGTKANVLFMIKRRDMNGSEMSLAEAMKKYNGYGMLLLGVQIIDLVEYEGESDFVEEEGSFKAEEADIFENGGDNLPFEDMTAAG
jgi:hypothetical protein